MHDKKKERKKVKSDIGEETNMHHRARRLKDKTRDILYYTNHTDVPVEYKLKERLEKEYNKFGNVRNLMDTINKESLYYVIEDMKPYEINHLTYKVYYNHREEEKGFFIPREEKSPGIDRITKQEYLLHEEEYNQELLQKIKEGRYMPKKTRGVEIPKPNGKKRQINIMCFQDNLLQKIIQKTLNIIYEIKFEDCSFGYRPRRNPKKAKTEIVRLIKQEGMKYVFDADIKSFFDNIDRKKLIEMIKKDIKDKKYVKLIELIASVESTTGRRETGVIQGGPISPILANIYLDEVLDKYIKKEREEANLVRYADDFIVLTHTKEEAEEVHKLIEERMKEYNLELAEDKTSIKKVSEGFNFLGYSIKEQEGKIHVGIDLNRVPKKETNFRELLDKIQEDAKIIRELGEHINYKEYIVYINTSLLGIYEYYTDIEDYIKWMNVFKEKAIEVILEKVPKYILEDLKLRWTDIDTEKLEIEARAITETLTDSIIYSPETYLKESGCRERNHAYKSIYDGDISEELTYEMIERYIERHNSYRYRHTKT